MGVRVGRGRRPETASAEEKRRLKRVICLIDGGFGRRKSHFAYMWQMVGEDIPSNCGICTPEVAFACCNLPHISEMGVFISRNLPHISEMGGDKAATFARSWVHMRIKPT